MDHRPGAGFRWHLASWRAEQEAMRERVPQPRGCEAIGSILNGSRKTRWHTTRAGIALLLGSLTLFAFSAAVGARSPLLVLITLVPLTGLFALFRVERSKRQEYGKPPHTPHIPQHREPLSQPTATTVGAPLIPESELHADPQRSNA